MPEPITTTEPQDPPIDPGAGELARLRSTNVELLGTKRTLKARVTELEAQTTELTGKLAAAENKLHIFTVQGPLKDLATDISKAPAALVQAFSRSYKLLPSEDGTLTLLHVADGKPVLVKDKPVPFTASAIKELLLASNNPADLELYRSILIVSKASGAIAPAMNRPSQPTDDRENKDIVSQFGLR